MPVFVRPLGPARAVYDGAMQSQNHSYPLHDHRHGAVTLAREALAHGGCEDVVEACVGMAIER